MSELAEDPALPADGSCARCGDPRRIEGVKPLYQKHAAEDPFCTTACAREWHGVKVSPTVPRGRRAYVSQLAQTG